jgi:hypothetical protein
MTRPNLLLIAAIALVVAFGVGYALGASGRQQAQQALAGMQEQVDLATARSAILTARVSLYNVNFGDAQRQLQDAQKPLTQARQRFDSAGNEAAVQAIGTALAHVQAAQELAGKLDQAANSQAAQALDALQAVK